MTVICKTIQEWQDFLSLNVNTTIGFVPTMGNIHQGHIELFQRSVRENKLTVVSLFVNPSQFNNQEDYDNYPKTFQQDLEKINNANVNVLFMPSVETMYPNPDNLKYSIIEDNISLELEGKYRPGHFPGVLTIILKLFNIIKPNKAYFGEKDYQQFKIIENFAKAFFLDIDIICCPTVRNKAGLALSSRNTRLSPQALEHAKHFPELLMSNMDCKTVIDKLQNLGFIVDYIEDFKGRRFGAVFLEGVRLIDNIQL
ncbi:MAG: pantoate--beta-alanine ligase, partial [Romboutsia sp.]|nr:pantoate--beta-alanine ligase [Romboutsia sp.]